MAILKKAWVDEDYVNLLMTDKKIIKFPIELNKKLRNSSPTLLNNIEITCNGTGLHWPDLDEDLSVVGIMEGRYDKSFNIYEVCQNLFFKS